MSSATIIVTFKVIHGKEDLVKKLLEDTLNETRSFDGCLSLEVFYEKKTNSYLAIEKWQSVSHYDKYLEWRIQTGIEKVLNPLLDGGWKNVLDNIKKFESPEQF